MNKEQLKRIPLRQMKDPAYPDSFVFRMKNNSMAPRIRPGYVLSCSPSAKWVSGDDCLVVLKNGKRLVRRIWVMENQSLCLIALGSAHQPKYPPITVKPSQVEQVNKITSIICLSDLIPKRAARP